MAQAAGHLSSNFGVLAHENRTLKDKLKNRELDLRHELKRVQDAIEAIEKNPDLVLLIDLLSGMKIPLG